MRVEIMGVPIDAVTRSEAEARVEAMLAEARPHVVTTPNPEMCVDARRDGAFLEALRSADLAVPDGYGLLPVSRRLGTPIPERISGSDFLVDVCRAAARARMSVFLLGGGEGVARSAADRLKEFVPGLRVAGAMSGGRVTKGAAPSIADEAMHAVRDAAPDVLFVGFGHGVQEKWIAAHCKEFPTVRLAMGVGGSFDFLAGRVRRAPESLRRLGLEWLWRLILEPWRAGRIWKAVVVFPYLALTAKR